MLLNLARSAPGVGWYHMGGLMVIGIFEKVFTCRDRKLMIAMKSW